MDIKFFHELASPSSFPKELLQELLNDGYAVEQLVEGQTMIKMTSKYFEELGDYIKKHPRELCKDYWARLVADTDGYDILEFVKQLCITHLTIKKLTDSDIDFCEEILEEL